MTVRVVAIGGSIGASAAPSRSEAALLRAAGAARARGADVEYFVGEGLRLPLYDPHSVARTVESVRLVEAVRRADALLIASPSYHGGVSGAVKNALDHLEDLAADRRPYLSERAVGCVAVGAGAQGTAAALLGLRDVVCALRGWPVPLGVTVCAERRSASGEPGEKTLAQLDALGETVVDFAERRGPTGVAAGGERHG